MVQKTVCEEKRRRLVSVVIEQKSYTTGWIVDALEVPRNRVATSRAPTTLFYSSILSKT